VGGVIVVGNSARLRDILAPVYEALELAWDPRAAGAVEDVAPGVGVEDVKRALLSEFAALRGLERVTIDRTTLALADELEAWHAPEGGRRIAAVRPPPPRDKAQDAANRQLG
jgi:hypothetical protein